MVLKKKKVDGAFLLQKQYLNHSNQSNDDPLKTMMCKDLREGLNIHKVISKFEKPVKGPNTSMNKGKTSVKGILKEFGTGLETNYYNFNKASLENPFSKYGVLLNNYKVKPRRKTHSAPPFLDFEEPVDLMQKMETTLEESKMNREKPKEIDDAKENYTFSIEDTVTRATSSTNTEYYKSASLRGEFSLSDELNESTYRKSLGLDTTRTYKTDYIDTSRTYKTESIESVTPFELESVATERVVYNPVEEIMNRLYKYTKNIFFDRTQTHSSMLGKTMEEGQNSTESRATMAIMNQNPSNICENLLERLEVLVYPRSKRSSHSSGRGSHYEANPQSESYNSQGYSRQYPPVGTETFSENEYPSMYNFTSKSNMYKDYNMARSHTEYEETTLDMTPNKYTSNDEYEEALLKVSTESASRTIMRNRNSLKELKPYDANDDFMLTDSEDYAILETRFGRIIYSPKLQDERYMYRFVVLTNEAQKAVEILSKSAPKNNFGLRNTNGGKRLLTEYEIIRELGIQMSSGWHHFFYFKNSQKELILRKPL